MNVGNFKNMKRQTTKFLTRLTLLFISYSMFVFALEQLVFLISTKAKNINNKTIPKRLHIEQYINKKSNKNIVCMQNYTGNNTLQASLSLCLR